MRPRYYCLVYKALAYCMKWNAGFKKRTPAAVIGTNTLVAVTIWNFLDAPWPSWLTNLGPNRACSMALPFQFRAWLACVFVNCSGA